MVHGAAGGVGSIAVQLARDLGARVIGTGRAGESEVTLGLGADAFVVCAYPAECFRNRAMTSRVIRMAGSSNPSLTSSNRCSLGGSDLR